MNKEEQNLDKSNEKLHISDVIDSKKYVYVYNHDGKDYYYCVDEEEGDLFVSDINDARIFTGKQIKSLQLDKAFDIGSEIYCDEINGYIELKSKPIRIEV